MTENQEKETGRIKWFNQEKGYGAIISDDGELCPFQIRVVSEAGFPDFKTGQLAEFTKHTTTFGIEAYDVRLI